MTNGANVILSQKQISQIQPQVKVTQIIFVALILGLFTAALLFSFIFGFNAKHKELTVLTLVGLAAGTSCIVLSFVIPKIVASSAKLKTLEEIDNLGEKADSEAGMAKLLGVFQTSKIIQFSLLEGAGFLNLILFIVDNSLICFGAAGLCIALMIAQFPPKNRIHDWLGAAISPQKFGNF